MMLALEFSTPPFHFLRNALANLLVYVAKLGVTQELGLQRHLAFKGAPDGAKMKPKSRHNQSQKRSKINPKASLKSFRGVRRGGTEESKNIEEN